MTAIRRDGNEDAVRAWIRREPRLDSRKAGIAVCDADLIVHRYKTPDEDRIGTRDIQCMMQIEYKQYGATVNESQLDTLRKFYLVIQAKDRKATIKRIKNPKTLRTETIHWYGVHLLRMSGSDPSTSDWIEWDHKRISLADLILILLFEKNPFYPHEKVSHRRHHSYRKDYHPRLPIVIEKR